ncbi:unnamed protein product [Plutella xylostella]|uniref:(diamondback moth) hypothetical protein n=1 Tax=Plutella xylostella TaxID=51655 RepID=A0A8S4DHR3_PLUXY|nr:unnamed protein product [Plutella xylostella]
MHYSSSRYDRASTLPVEDEVGLRRMKTADSPERRTSGNLACVCTSTKVRVPLSTINVVNLVLCALILLVLGRFLYDWHLFKTTGKLPWISSILP